MSKGSEGTDERDDRSRRSLARPRCRRADPGDRIASRDRSRIAVRATMADLAGLREISSARASFDLTLDRRGRVHVTGTVRARIGQTCVVTLDPIDNEIDETVDVMFAPSEQIPQLADLAHEALAGEAEIPDPPEPIVNGVIDLGRLATDVLLLAIDPYPRKPDAVFGHEVADRRSRGPSFCRAESAAARAENVGCEETQKRPKVPRNGCALATSLQADRRLTLRIEK